MSWNPFKKHEDELSSTPNPQPRQGQGKGRPTPKRRQAQEENLRPLVPKDRKASAKAAKARARVKEDAQYEAMRTGDVTHMPMSERLPWRVYIRDYVDARFNLAEWFIPVILVLLILSMALNALRTTVFFYIFTIAVYVYFAAVVFDVIVMWRKLKKKLVAKYGERSVAKGSRSATYAWQRATQMRRWRMPKPRYPKRGHWPE